MSGLPRHCLCCTRGTWCQSRIVRRLAACDVHRRLVTIGPVALFGLLGITFFVGSMKRTPQLETPRSQRRKVTPVGPATKEDGIDVSSSSEEGLGTTTGGSETTNAGSPRPTTRRFSLRQIYDARPGDASDREQVCAACNNNGGKAVRVVQKQRELEAEFRRYCRSLLLPAAVYIYSLSEVLVFRCNVVRYLSRISLHFLFRL